MEKLILWGKAQYVRISITTTVATDSEEFQIIGIHLTDDSEPADLAPFLMSVDDVLQHSDCPVLICGSSREDAEIRQITSLGVARERLIPEKLIQHVNISCSRYLALLRSRISIFSNYCWGGFTYHFFGLPFLSPTISMYFEDQEYLAFLKNLDEMLQLIPEHCGSGYDERQKRVFPVFKIGTVRLFMNHCSDPDEGKQKWIERCKRVNHDNLLITMITPSRSIAEQFSRLPYTHKFCFVPFKTDLPCCIYVDTHGRDLVTFVNSFASGTNYLYDPIALLEQHTIKTSNVRIPEKSEIRNMLDRSQQVLIYGAQILGHRAFELSAPSVADRLRGFAVTEMNDNPETKDGLPVKSISSWSEELDNRQISKDNVLIILALHPKYYREVEESLSAHGFSRFLHLYALDYYFAQEEPD